jgi:hypothetical protein
MPIHFNPFGPWPTSSKQGWRGLDQHPHLHAVSGMPFFGGNPLLLAKVGGEFHTFKDVER